MTRTLFVVLMTFLTFSSLSADDPLRQIRRILRLDEEQTQLLRPPASQNARRLAEPVDPEMALAGQEL